MFLVCPMRHPAVLVHMDASHEIIPMDDEVRISFINISRENILFGLRYLCIFTLQRNFIIVVQSLFNPMMLTKSGNVNIFWTYISMLGSGNIRYPAHQQPVASVLTYLAWSLGPTLGEWIILTIHMAYTIFFRDFFFFKQGDVSIVASFDRRGECIYTGNSRGKLLILSCPDLKIKNSFRIGPGTSSAAAIKSIEFSRRTE